VLSLARRLQKRLGVQVETFDERFSTAVAARVLDEAGIRPSRRAGTSGRYAASIDRVAATLILENYLETGRNAEKSEG
jgi:RNase H-fold protein (predicted Holliday junction resolvase)